MLRCRNSGTTCGDLFRRSGSERIYSLLQYLFFFYAKGLRSSYPWYCTSKLTSCILSGPGRNSGSRWSYSSWGLWFSLFQMYSKSHDQCSFKWGRAAEFDVYGPIAPPTRSPCHPVSQGKRFYDKLENPFSGITYWERKMHDRRRRNRSVVYRSYRESCPKGYSQNSPTYNRLVWYAFFKTDRRRTFTYYI